MNESVDRRVLGAFQFQDVVTGNSVLDNLAVAALPLLVRPNRCGIYVIFNAPGFADLTGQFDPPLPGPKAGTFEISVQDPSRRYLPRRVKLQVPQNLPAAIDPSKPFDPGKVLSDPRVIFNPQAVPLYPSPAAPVAPTWAAIHISVVRSGIVPLTGLPWCAVQVTHPDNGGKTKVLATTVTDARGEGLLAIPGLGPEISGSETGAVTKSNVSITITAGYDPSIAIPPPDTWVPNPDEIISKLGGGSLKTASLDDEIAPGQTLNRTLAISV